ncbi:aspartate aminotransferase family protein [Corynebacterium alimapuense]|uniref:Aspartate aminotransferase family protein n=1 Tax=Corynebacterium alimapuense TaxID=1576874 RepID=A0A3M8K844_9CORY|nr:aspartate aminotransferase family protein [Corynebacterium alimapuense]RNE49316.1 aspartate aminotransferase family protein [Corynebacterium alimapuense]
MTTATVTTDMSAERVSELDNSHVFHSWAAQDLFNALPVVSGSESSFTDYEGNTYLDFGSQLVNLNLGHQHPRLVRAIQDQAEKLATIQPAFANDARSELARLLAEAAPGALNQVFFTNAGADANEHAVRMARLHTGRQKVMSMYRSYHGATTTAISMTGDPRRWPNDQGDPSVVHFFGPYAYRSAFWAADEAQECERALAHLEEQIILEGASTIAAIIIETVVGTNGILVPPAGYLPGIRALCDKYGILYIADEVMVGFGRTGTMFAVENFQAQPDLLTFAKGVTSGYVPLGGVLISDAVRDSFATTVYPGGLTYSGHPLGCAVGVETFAIFEDEQILEHTRQLGDEVVAPFLAGLADKYEVVGQYRGLGLLWAIELVTDRDTREPLVPFHPTAEQNEPMLKISAACKAAGLWPMLQQNRIHIAPPLIISEQDLRRGLEIIEDAIKEI